MAEPMAAETVAPSDLESYQHAVRLVLTNDVITASRPTAAALKSVLAWADRMAKDFQELLGYRLEATAHHVRLIRRLDLLDGTQHSLFAAKSGRSFDRRRLAYLCLVLAAFHRSRTEIDLVDLVTVLGPSANAIDGLGFEATVTEHKRAVVDVVDWLVERGALRLSDGDAESWAKDSEHGDALYDIDHDICTTLFRPLRPLQFVDSARGLLDVEQTEAARRSVQREAAARRARRLLVEHPVVYFGQVDEATGAALRSAELAENLARMTGLSVERRAEGVALVDGSGRFTDRRFPGRGGAVARAAGLILAKIADLLEDPDSGPGVRRMTVPTAAEVLDDLIARIDAGRHTTDSLPVSASATVSGGERTPAWEAPFIETAVLESMMRELYEEFGAGSFTEQWKYDTSGLLTEAVVLLTDLGLVHRVPGGVLVLPAAARYRNIKAAVPRRDWRDDQLALDLSDLLTEGQM